jgi:hypothetical protein
MNLGTIWSKNKIIRSNNARKPITNIKPVILDVNNKKTRMFWGAATWHFFHIIAARISPHFYAANYKYIWDFIVQVCSNLPCPFCRQHAVNYITKIPLHSINTRPKFEKVLFDFHNSVNSRTGKNIENIQVLEKYKRAANIQKICNFFETRFFHSYIGRRNFDDWMKNEFKIKYYAFLNKIGKSFVRYN